MKVEQELLILGLLKDKPRHGYEIKKQIKEVISTFTALEEESIYYSLTLFEKKGFVKKIVRSQEARPEKFIYSLTPKGDERFTQLLTKSLITVERPKFNIDISLYFLPYLSIGVALRRLKARARILARIEEGLKKVSEQLSNKSSYHLQSIVTHDLELLQAEKKFIQDISEKMEKQKISLPEWPHES